MYSGWNGDLPPPNMYIYPEPVYVILIGKRQFWQL